MTRGSYVSSLIGGALLIACGGPAAPGGSGGGTTTTGAGEAGHEETGVPVTGDGGPSSGSPTSTGDTTGAGVGDTSSGTGADTTGAGDDCGCNFLCEGECGETGVTSKCDVFAQDCPEGEKCSAFAEGGGSSWNATKCVPVTGEGVPGDVCTAEGGGLSGVDDCRKGAFCWDVDTENKGVCVELCGGTADAPTCPDEVNFSCAVVNEGVLNLCLPACDPLIQDCPGDDLCIPVDDNFVCVLDASGDAGKAFDPCELLNACDRGLLCANTTAGMECDPNAGGCCVPLCDLSDADATCPGVGQKCVAFFEEGQAPPEYVNVGLCAIPE